MTKLQGKRILFVSPRFFGYEEAIRQRLQTLGARVEYVDERPANSFWTKAFIRLNPTILSFSIRKYYESLWHRIRFQQYDYVFVINIEAMPVSFLKALRESSKDAEFILYMWDSVMNKKNTVSYLPFFDAVFSFDKNDCHQIPSIRFRPLFFLPAYEAIACSHTPAYDLSFVGTAHSDRFLLIDLVRKQAAAKGMKSYWYLYLQSRKLFLWNKFRNPAYQKARLSDFHYTPLSTARMIEIIKKSEIILDIQHPRQSGLTMRTIEMLGAKRKLITTNAAIADYDFYCPENILIIDRDQPVLSESFCHTPYRPVDERVYARYSLDGWLEEIFDRKQQGASADGKGV